VTKRRIEFWDVAKGEGLKKRSKNLRVVWDTHRIPDNLGKIIMSPVDLARVSSGIYRALQKEGLIPVDREAILGVYTDNKNRVLGVSVISIGTKTASLFDPSDFLRPAVVIGATSSIMVHHHPSGDPSPSPEDVAVTRRLEEAGKILGIKLLDSCVVGGNNYVSILHHGKGMIENPYSLPEVGQGASIMREKNPELMILGNPTETRKLAEEQFRRFHGTKPRSRKVDVEGEDFLVEIGRLKEVVYHPQKGIRADAEWFHRFRNSILAASVDGQRLYIVPADGSKPLRFDPDRGIIGG
jgi:hypothetical protein